MPLANYRRIIKLCEYASTDRIAGVVKGAALICIDAAADLCRDVQPERAREEHLSLASPHQQSTHGH